jgi:hypothetical protein
MGSKRGSKRGSKKESKRGSRQDYTMITKLLDVLSHDIVFFSILG